MKPKLGVAGWLALAWIVMLIVLAIIEPFLPLRDPDALGIRTREVARYEPPGANAWFGGGSQGQDQFARVIAGIRPALILGLTVTVLAGAAGGMLGAMAGYLRGRFDRVATSIIDMSLAFPALVLVIASQATFGNTMTVLIVIFAVTGIAPYARIIRGATLVLAEREFVTAARAMGATRGRILWRELAPNLAIPMLSFACLGIAFVILTEGALAFLQLSLDQTTWGRLIAEGAGEIKRYPHVALIPSTVMFLTVLAFNMLGDAAQSLISPRPIVTTRRATTSERPDEARVEHGDALPLRIEGLRTVLHTDTADLTAVDDVKLTVNRGEVLGIVGESGSGKTMLLRSIVGAFPLSNVSRHGIVDVAGTDMLRAPDDEVRRTLGTKVGMISQNPMNALHPTRRIGDQITEPMTVHGTHAGGAATERALELLRAVGISEPERRMRQYPHQLSGGMRQRVTIAIALANEPDLLLADEPTTALDVTVQAQILRLLADIQREQNMAVVLVTHDLAVIEQVADRVAVMYAGQIVETATVDRLFDNPQHHYTRALLAAVPSIDADRHDDLAVIDGAPPALADITEGCRFAPRCPIAHEHCHAETPPMHSPVSVTHRWRCWYPGAQRVAAPAGTAQTGEAR